MYVNKRLIDLFKKMMHCREDRLFKKEKLEKKYE